MNSSPEVRPDEPTGAINPESLTDRQLVIIHEFVNFGIAGAHEIKFLEQLVATEKMLAAPSALREKAVRGIDALLVAKKALAEAASPDAEARAAMSFRSLCPRALGL